MSQQPDAFSLQKTAKGDGKVRATGAYDCGVIIQKGVRARGADVLLPSRVSRRLHTVLDVAEDHAGALAAKLRQRTSVMELVNAVSASAS